MREFVKWNVSSEMLSKAGWLPHYTTPFDCIAECGDDIEAIRSRLLQYYESNWQDVRLQIESRLSDYKIDAEAKATFVRHSMLMKLGFIGAYAVSYFQKSNECFAPRYLMTKLDI